MRHPHYHLRVNKAVDRLALVEAIRHLAKLGDLSEYTYYGLGGPYLADLRLLYELFPRMGLVSIEQDEETYKRQVFHRPCATLRLEKAEVKSFLAHFQSHDRKSIFWLDFTGLKYEHFTSFSALLGKVAAGSMVKVTLESEPGRFAQDPEEFQRRFGAVMPDPTASPPLAFRDFAYLLQDMLQLVAEKALPEGWPNMFQPVSSFCYSDGAGMLTLTGVVCLRTEEAETRQAFHGWQFANLNWAKPKRIDVPVLSTKERLFLESRLPCTDDAGRALRQALGYLIDESKSSTEHKLKQYADFHRYAPYFIRGVP